MSETEQTLMSYGKLVTHKCYPHKHGGMQFKAKISSMVLIRNTRMQAQKALLINIYNAMWRMVETIENENQLKKTLAFINNNHTNMVRDRNLKVNHFN